MDADKDSQVVSFVRDGTSSWLHYLAAVVLLLFAVSHFASLAIRDSSHGLDNTVFPFLSNKTMYLVAGVFEMTIGLLCVKFHGRNLTNVIILTFVSVIGWYRFAHYFTGGGRCGCLGILGRLLHISQTQETLLPIIALILLTLTTVPWLFRIMRRPVRHLSLNRALVLLLATQQQSHGEQTIEVRGQIDAARYSPVLGTPFKETQVHVGFLAVISGKTWKMCATNLEDNIWWGQIICDSTNIYTLSPEGGHLWLGERPQSNSVFATVSPSPFYCAPMDDTLGLASLYVTYALSPECLISNKDGVVQMALPWQLGRQSPRAYGYKWIIHAEGRFLEEFEVVRDESLDLSDKEELLRWQVDYPHSVADRNGYRQSLDYRKEIPTGFIEATYRCTEWYRTNSIVIPKASQLTYYLYGANPKQPYRFHHYQANLTALTVNMRDDLAVTMLVPTTTTRIHDYRYKKATSKRIFDYAEYSLHSGESWKSGNDPQLLAQVEYYLKHGPRIDSAIYSISNRNVFVWLFGVLALAPLIAMLWRRKTTK